MFEQGFFEIGDIIVIGIVFVLLFIYNRIEKNSKTLEKVRKYAEKSKAELDKVINAKKSEIRDLTIDLEVEEKRNREILDRFSQARDQLMSESQHMNQLRELVGKNSSQMENLQKMALHVDENLQKLKAESEYIDGVGRRLNDVQKQENSLIKGLNGINAAFQKSNQASLDQLRGQFTNQLKGDLSSMQEDMVSLRNDLNLRMENAADRGRILEEEIFTALKEDIENRARGLEENWMGGITELKSKVAAQVEDIQNHITTSSDHVNQWQTENLQRMESLSGKVIDIEREASDDAARFRLEVMQQAEEKQKEYEEILSRNFSHIETMILDFEKMESTLKSSLTDTADNLKAEFQQYKASMEQEMTAIQKDAGAIAKDIQEQFQDVEQVKADFINTIENSRSEMERDLREKMIQVQDQLETQWKEFDEAAVEARQQERDRAEKDLERINEIMREMDRTFEGLQQDTREAVEEKLALFEQDTQGQILQWKENLDTQLEEISENHIRAKEALEQRYNSELEGFNSQILVLNSRQEESRKELEDKYLKELEDRLTRKSMDWNTNLEIIESRTAELETSLDSWKSRMKQQLEELSLVQREEREELERRYFSEIEENLKQKGAGIDETLVSMENRAGDLKDALEHFSRDWAEQREELDKAQTAKLQEEIASLENGLNEKMNRLSQRAQDIELRIKEEILASSNEINNQKELMAENISEFRKQTEESIQEIDQEVAGARKLMEDSREEYSRHWTGFQEEADQYSRQIMGELEKDLKDYKGAVSQRYRRLDGFIGELDKLEGSLRRNIADITQRVQREFESFDSQMKELRDSERSNAENELQGVHSEIQLLQGALDKVKENAVTNLTQALAGFEEQFNGNLAEKDLVMRDKISDLEHDLHNNIKEVTGEQIQRQEEMEMKLEENLRQRLDSIKNDVSSDFSQFREKTDQMKSEVLTSLNQNEEQYLNLKQDLNSSIENLKIEAGSVLETLKGSMEEAQDLRERFSGELNGFQLLLESRIKDLEENLGSVQSEAEQQLKSRFDEFEENITTSLSLRNSDINKRIDEWQNGFSHHLEETVLMKNRELEKFDNDLHDDFSQQLEGLESRINDQFGVIQNMARQYREGVLSEVEVSGKEFEAYKHKMEQEMGRLKEFTDSTVDQIKGKLTETSSIKEIFREQMDDFREQASSDIENLDGEIKERINSITNQLDNTTEAMEAVLMKNIENRQKSYEGIITGRFEKLEGFISDFEDLENSLRKSMDDEVIRVQNEFDHFSDKMVKMRAEERKQLDNESEALRRSLSDLENRLNELKSQAHENMSEKLQMFEDDFFRDLKNRDTLLQEKLDEWQDSIENDCTQISEESVLKRKQLEEHYQRELDSKLTGIQDHLYQEINRLNDEVKGFRGELVNQFQSESEGQKNEMIAMINGARQDVELWQNQVLQQLKDEKASISENISHFKHSLVDNVKIMEEDFQNHSSSIQEQIQSAQSVSEQRLGSIKESLTQTQNDVEEMRNQLSNSIQEEYTVLRGSITELEQAQQNYISQTGIFERTDALQENLNQSLASLESKIIEVGQHRDDLSGMENELARVMTMYQEGSDQMARFLKEKQKIDLMEEKIGRIMQISDSVDQKLVSFTDINDTFQDYSIKMKQLEDLHKDMEERYDRLTKKTPVLDTTVNGLDKAYETLSLLEQQIKNVSEAVLPLKGEIEQIENRNNNLFLESDKVDLVVKRVGSLDSILNGIEERIDHMEKAREWMARLEKRMEEISKDARDKVRLLGTLTDKSGKSSKKSQGAPDSSTRDMVVKLSREGWTPKDIASSTNLGVGEVELILEMTTRTG